MVLRLRTFSSVANFVMLDRVENGFDPLPTSGTDDVHGH